MDTFCIAEGEGVELVQGVSVPIESVAVGDWVHGLADDGAGVVGRAVTAVMSRGPRECVELLFSDGRTLTCTPDHRILTAAGQWVEAGRLVVGETQVSVGPTYPLQKYRATQPATPTSSRRSSSAHSRSASASASVVELTTDSEHEEEEQEEEEEAEEEEAEEGDSDVETPLDQPRPPAADLSVNRMRYGVPRSSTAMPTSKVKLVGRRPVGVKNTFDLTVPAPAGVEPSFTANGVVVHNCHVLWYPQKPLVSTLHTTRITFTLVQCDTMCCDTDYICVPLFSAALFRSAPTRWSICTSVSCPPASTPSSPSPATAATTKKTVSS